MGQSSRGHIPAIWGYVNSSFRDFRSILIKILAALQRRIHESEVCGVLLKTNKICRSYRNPILPIWSPPAGLSLSLSLAPRPYNPRLNVSWSEPIINAPCVPCAIRSALPRFFLRLVNCGVLLSNLCSPPFLLLLFFVECFVAPCESVVCISLSVILCCI